MCTDNRVREKSGPQRNQMGRMGPSVGGMTFCKSWIPDPMRFQQAHVLLATSTANPCVVGVSSPGLGSVTWHGPLLNLYRVSAQR